MAYVTNLGQYGSARESPLSGFSEALATGLDLGQRKRESQARMASDTSNTAMRVEEHQLNKQRLTAELAKAKADEMDKNRSNTVKTVEQLSLYLNDKSPQEQQVFKQTDHYKQVQKIVKEYAPEFIDDNGDIIPLQNKDIYETQLSKIAATNAQVLQSGGQLSPGQQQAQDLLDKVEPRILASVLDAASNDPDMFDATPEERQAILKKYLDSAMQTRQMIKSSGNPITRGLGSPTDPLGLF